MAVSNGMAFDNFDEEAARADLPGVLFGTLHYVALAARVYTVGF
jgi:hypothetical protein